MKQIRYTDHGEARRVERRVSKQEVDWSVRNPGVTLPKDSLGRTRLIGYPPGANGKGLFVVYNEDATDIWIVSVYWVGA